MAVNQHNGDWRDSFIFIGNQLALDFLNTRPLVDGTFMELLPDIAALLRWFLAAKLLDNRQAARLHRKWHGGRIAQRVLEEMREFREQLREDVILWEAGTDLRGSKLRQLDRLLGSHPMRTRIKSDEDKLSTELWFLTEKPKDLYAPLAYSAAKLFTEVDRTRIRKCGACILHFLDTSKKGTRHWCSMQLCGNRSKVTAYTARQRLTRK